MSTIVQCIAPNPDIAGIGVRVSIYAQAFLSMIHPIVVGWHGEVMQPDDIKSLHTMYLGILLTAVALLISAFIQASIFGLSVYHTLIVLNLSWINNTNASIFVFYVLGSWMVGEEVYRDEYSERAREGTLPVDEGSLTRAVSLGQTSASSAGTPSTGFFFEAQDEAHKLFRARSKWSLLTAGGLTSIHLTIVAALGLWLWFNIHSPTFGGECTDNLTYAVFNRDIPVNSKVLIRVSKAAYFLTLIPFLNLWLFWSLLQPVLAPPLLVLLAGWFVLSIMEEAPPKWLPDSIRQYMKKRTEERRGLDSLGKFGIGILYLMSILVCFGVQVYFIICNERMIRVNALLLEGGEERQWTFGQTLAVGITAIPLMETYKLVRRRIKKRKQRSQSNTTEPEQTSLIEMDILDWRDIIPIESGLERGRRNSM